MRILQDRRGFSIPWWGIFFAFVLVPLIVLGMGVARWAIATAEVQAAADLAALAAARDVAVRIYETEGHVQFADQVPYWTAERYANLNTDYLDRYDIQVHVVGIYVDELNDTVTVRVATDLSPLFTEFGLPLDRVIEREGEAEARMRAWVP